MKTRIKGLDGIRGTAAVAVVFCHCVAGSTQIGGYAVDLFFALSGFLILQNLNDSRRDIELGTASFFGQLANFWRRRAARIFPAYYVVTAIVMTMLVFSDQIKPLYVIFYVTYTQNLLMAAHGDWLPFGYSWTLGVEQQFYTMFAPLMLLISTADHRLFLGFVSIFIYVALLGCLIGGVNAFSVFNLPLVGFILASVGGICALSSPKGIIKYFIAKRVVIPCAITCAILAVFPSSFFATRLYLNLIQISFYLLGLPLIISYIAFHPESRTVRILEKPLFRFYGVISYSLYLIHGELVALIKPHWFTVAGLKPAESFAIERLTLFAAILSISTLLAYLSYRFIEKIFYRKKYTNKYFVESHINAQPAVE